MKGYKVKNGFSHFRGRFALASLIVYLLMQQLDFEFSSLEA